MPRAKKAAVQQAPEDMPDDAVVAAAIAPSAIVPIPLRRLMRAPENVRQTNKAVDVESLADDIAAHGLLQSLIGYAGDTDIDAAAVYIVGGGRRLAALGLLLDRGAIDDSFPVPVLLRDPDEAVSLSLSENLAKRDMNAADEFVAFDRLLQRGSVSPADLAKQFGFSERYVKQRLRLAALAPEILDALREGKLTIDAAMAYAGTQDQTLQLKIFASEEKKASGGWSVHTPMAIRSGITNAQMTTGDALFKFVGAKDYEKKGGRYEDDLFGNAESYSGRKLVDPGIITAIAADRASFQKIRLLAEAKAKHATTSDVLLAPGLRGGRKPKSPKGYALVERPYYRQDVPGYAELRDRAGELGMDIIMVASVNHGGTLEIEEQFFVPGARLAELIPAKAEAPRKSEAELAAERRATQVRSVAAWLAARKIRDDKVDGRAFWRTMRPDLWRSSEVEGVGECYAVGIDVLVTPEEIDAELEAAEAEYDRQEAEKIEHRAAEEQAKAEAAAAQVALRERLLALDPPPAVIDLGGTLLFRWESGIWLDAREDAEIGAEYEFDDLEEALDWAASDDLPIGEYWMSLAEFDREEAANEAEEQVA